MFQSKNNTPLVTMIIGAQWGGEGKGKITDYYSANADYVVRFQGDHNAGHTVTIDCEAYTFHLIPAGILHKNATSIIGNGVLVDPKILQREVLSLQSGGVSPNLKISERAQVIMPYHKALDELISEHQAELASESTRSGMCAANADKAYRHGIRMGDLLDHSLFKKKLTVAYDFNIKIITQVFNRSFPKNEDQIFQEYTAYANALKPYIGNTEIILQKAFQEGKAILFEGAHGAALDPDHGVYPYTTSTSCMSAYAEIGSGVGLNIHSRRIGVTKAYVSLEGESPFPTELTEDAANFLREKGNEYSTITNCPLRVGWLDLIHLQHAVKVNGCTELALTKLDVLGGFHEINMCTGYHLDGKHLSYVPASINEFKDIRPVYQTLPGWSVLSADEIHHIIEKGYKALPETMRHYIETIEQAVECPIRTLSFGPKREQTMVRS